MIGDKQCGPNRDRTARRGDRRDVTGVRRQGSLIGLDIGRRIRNREPANNLVKRRFVGDKDCSPNRDRAARRRDRRDVAGVRRQGRQIGLDIGRRVRNREPANDFIERCCIGDKGCSPDRDRTTRCRDRCNETGVRRQGSQIGLDIGGRVRNRKPTNNLVKRRFVGDKDCNPNRDRTARAVIDVMWLASAARAARLAWTLAAVSEIANPPAMLFSDD